MFGFGPVTRTYLAAGVRAYFAHGAVHLVVFILCVAVFISIQWLTSLRFWIMAALYIVMHLGIDRAKQGLVSTAKLTDSSSVFVLDHALHACNIGGLAWFLIRPSWAALKSQFSWSTATGDRVLEAGIVYVEVVFAGGYLIRYLTRNLMAGIKKPGETAEQVENAGMYIGWSLLTGKSIARFPELKGRFAEYFLIGTLLSIGLGVVAGLVLAKLWYGTIT